LLPGNLYVSNYGSSGNSFLLKVAAGSGAVSTLVPTAAGVLGAQGLAFDPAGGGVGTGTLYLACSGAHMVYKARGWQQHTHLLD
jgi:hypothetical protein